MSFENHESTEVFFCPVCKTEERGVLSWIKQKDVYDQVFQRVRKQIKGTVNVNEIVNVMKMSILMLIKVYYISNTFSGVALFHQKIRFKIFEKAKI